jgi:hypothetical protein
MSISSRVTPKNVLKVRIKRNCVSNRPMHAVASTKNPQTQNNFCSDANFIQLLNGYLNKELDRVNSISTFMKTSTV